MSDEEDYSSADDEDYVPSDKEGVSEEDESGDEEDLTLLQEGGNSENKIATAKGKRKKKTKDLIPRKRRGGIQLEGENNGEATPQDDVENTQLKEEIAKEQETVKVEKQKKKADDLWASFLSDVGQKPKEKPRSAGGLGSLTSVQSKPKTTTTTTTTTGEAAKPTTAPPPQKITVTKVFDFAGEEIKVKEEVNIESKEGQKELQRLEDERSGEEAKDSVESKPLIGRVLCPAAPSNSTTKSAGGLGSVLGKIGKKNKLSVLTKSKLDWDSYKKDEGIEEDLKIHNRGKDGYIERMAFLQRADLRQFEIEKSMRQSSSKR